jgi:hypothetical protein
MDDRKYAFLKAVLGDDGACSLKKAADRIENLESAIVPRAIMAWLGVAARGDYEGELPGVEDSYLDFAKNIDSTYTGSIAIGSGVFPFQNASVFHLAASVALALDAEFEDTNIKDTDLVKLGKSIDVLAKAKYVASADDLIKKIAQGKGAGSGAPGAPTRSGVPAPPKVAAPPTKQIGQPGPVGKQPKGPPKEAKPPKATIPKLKVTAKKSFQITAKSIDSKCKECGLALVKNEKFVGCMCLKETARFVDLAKHDAEHYVITFGKAMDDDAVATVLDTLGVSRHGR